MLHSWRAALGRSDELERADTVFVLAGHTTRKIFGAMLYRDGWAPAVVMSTGNPAYIAGVLETETAGSGAIDANVLRQLHSAAKTPSPQGHFFARLDRTSFSTHKIPTGPLGTLAEIRAFGMCLRADPSIRRVLIVSARLHLRRLRLCCEHFLPANLTVRYIASALTQSELAARHERPERDDDFLVILELIKVLVYRIVLPFTRR